MYEKIATFARTAALLPIILYSCCRKHCTIVANLTALHLAKITALLFADNSVFSTKLFLSDERGHYHQSDIIMDAKTGRCQSGSTYMNFSDKGTNLLELGKLMFSFIRK